MQVQTNLKAGRGKTGREMAGGRLTRESCQKELEFCAMMASHGHSASDYLTSCIACLNRFPDLAPGAE